MRTEEFEDGINPKACDYPGEYIIEVQRHIKKDENGNPVYINAVILSNMPKEDTPRVKSLVERVVDLEARMDKAEKI